LGIFRAVRDQRTSGFGVIALATGLSLHGHPQLSYYLMVAGLIWGLFLLFIHEGRPSRNDGVKIAIGCVLAVALGFGVYAIQALPFMEYIPFSPRGAGGPSTGWEYATAFSLPIEELMTTVLPQFNGVIEHYWGRN